MAVEAASVVFGRFKGGESVDCVYDGRGFLERWLKRVCLDYRLREVGGLYTVDLLFPKPVNSFWLTNCVQVYAKRWGFSREQWVRENMRTMTREEYLHGPTPIVSEKVTALLTKIYENVAEYIVGKQSYDAMCDEGRRQREASMERRKKRRMDEAASGVRSSP